MKIGKAIICGAVSASIVMGGATANAAVFGSSDSSRAGVVASGSLACPHESDEVVSFDRIEDVALIENLKGKVGSGIRSGEIRLTADLKDFDFSAVRVFENKASGKQSTAVMVPAVEGERSLMSGVTAFYEQGRLAGYSELHVTRNENGNFQLLTSVDGGVAESKDSGIKWFSDREMFTESAVLGSSGWMSNMDKCLATTLGISGGAAVLIGVLCKANCGVAVTNVLSMSVCAACVGGVIGLAGKSFNAATRCFSL